MSSEFAGCGENQSGQRFLDGSDPRLRRHAASCETAGRESWSLPAGKDQKPSRELEGGALISAEGAVPPLLGLITAGNRRTRHLDLSTPESSCGCLSGRYSAIVEPTKP
jgi:hypothetical protein